MKLVLLSHALLPRMFTARVGERLHHHQRKHPEGAATYRPIRKKTPIMLNAVMIAMS